MAVFAPRPSASVRMAASANPGCRQINRSPCRMSRIGPPRNLDGGQEDTVCAESYDRYDGYDRYDRSSERAGAGQLSLQKKLTSVSSFLVPDVPVVPVVRRNSLPQRRRRRNPCCAQCRPEAPEESCGDERERDARERQGIAPFDLEQERLEQTPEGKGTEGARGHARCYRQQASG